MRGIIGIVVGLVIIALGLGGLGVALAQMMTHANPNGALISVGGLGLFIAAMAVLLAGAR
jgi:hypothetical protein